MHSTYGYTLIELIIVIVILGILAALPFYLLPGTVINIGAQAKQFADDIRYTQSLSMSKAERYRIIKLSNTSYQILNSSGSSITFPTGSNSINLNSGLSFGSWTNLGNNLVAFDGKGIPYSDTAIPGTSLAAGTTYSITITGGGNSKIITITPITGSVTIQ